MLRHTTQEKEARRTEVEKESLFFLFLAETGENILDAIWDEQYKMLKAGLRNGQIHDAALVAWSRMEAKAS